MLFLTIRISLFRLINSSMFSRFDIKVSLVAFDGDNDWKIDLRSSDMIEILFCGLLSYTGISLSSLSNIVFCVLWSSLCSYRNESLIGKENGFIYEKSPLRDLNPRPFAYETNTITTMLSRRYFPYNQSVYNIYLKSKLTNSIY